jgi:hypothetical protein
MDDPKRADYWRKRATEARHVAERSDDAVVKRRLQRMAMTYDRLADALAGAETPRPILRLVHSTSAGRR